MKTRLIIGIVIGVIATVILAFGLIDPLEGGIALLISATLFVIVRLVSAVPMPGLWWIPTVVAIIIGATAIGVALLQIQGADTTATVANPLSGGLIALVWAYRVAIVAALAGAVVYDVRLARALRAPAATVPPQDADTTGGV